MNAIPASPAKTCGPLEISIPRGNDERSCAHLTGLLRVHVDPTEKACKPRPGGRQLGRPRREDPLGTTRNQPPARTTVRHNCLGKWLRSFARRSRLSLDRKIARPWPTVCLNAGWVVHKESWAFMQCFEISSTVSTVSFCLPTRAREP